MTQVQNAGVRERSMLYGFLWLAAFGILGLAGCSSDQPTDERIALSSEVDGDWEILILDLSANTLREVTDNETFDWGARWSPDGETLAFSTQYLAGEMEQAYVRNEAGVMELMTQEITTDRDIVTTPTDRFDLTRLMVKNAAVEDDPDWSPDGSKLAFISDRTGDVEVFVMDADGSNVDQLTDSAGEDWHPDWSPDGSQILFTSKRNGTWDVFVMDADGSNVSQLTPTNEDEWRPTWSPDGSQIAFAGMRQGRWHIFVMDADGSNVRQITDSTSDDFEPVWSPNGDRLAYASAQLKGPHVLLIVDLDDGETVELGVFGIPSDWTDLP
jgi:Tol biopolymer transport system component